MFQKTIRINNVLKNSYPDTRTRTKPSDTSLSNNYRKIGVIAKILDIIPEKDCSHVNFR